MNSAGSGKAILDSTGRFGVGIFGPSGKLGVENVTAGLPTGTFLHASSNLTSYTNLFSAQTYTANSVNFQYCKFSSGNGSAVSDDEFNFRGDGNAY